MVRGRVRRADLVKPNGLRFDCSVERMFWVVT